MNSFKISLKNIRKCWKDYSVYFLTLIFGVAIFYMFNSLGDQGMVKSLPKTGYDIIQLMVQVLEVMSVFVAFTLGLLIVYANNFLIKRRKKEFGVYLMLGMSKKKVSGIIIGETLIVGLLSLLVGITIGIFGSQFLSILLVKMFETNVTEFVFSFSAMALQRTCIYFICIFLVVMVFNTFTVSKYELITLLTAEKHNEKNIMKNPMLSFVLTVIAIAMLIFAYNRVAFYSLELTRTAIVICILMGIVATFLFFFGVSGFLFEVLKANKKMYFKGLNSFIIRQYCSSITTSTFSVSLICLILFMAISAFSFGFSMQKTLNDNIRKMTPVDLCLSKVHSKPSDLLKEKGILVESFLEEGYEELNIYGFEELTLGTSFGSVQGALAEQFPLLLTHIKEDVIKLSDYNRLAKLYGYDELKLKENQYAVLCNFEMSGEFRNASIAAGDQITLGNRQFESLTPTVIDGFIYMEGLGMNMGVFIFPDDLWEEEVSYQNTGYLLIGNYVDKDLDHIYALEDRIMGAIGEYETMQEDENGDAYYELMVNTKRGIADSNKGLSVTVIFIVMYLGLVFIITGAAILALKTLSGCIDSVQQYEILKKMGTGAPMMKKAAFINVVLIFMMPLVLAVIHSIFGIMFGRNLLVTFNLTDMFSGVVTTAILMLVVYGGYMLASYLGSLRILNLD